MKLGVFTALFSQLPLDEMLKKLTSLDIHSVELGTGNYPGDAHCKLSLLEDESGLQRFRDNFARYNVSISALSCHGNPLDPERAKHDREINRNTLPTFPEVIPRGTAILLSRFSGGLRVDSRSGSHA
jgi:sugar phosphate isomerase/epimerase